MIRKLILLLMFAILVNVLPGCSLINGPVDFRILISGGLNNRLGPCG